MSDDGKRKRCETPDEHYKSPRPEMCTTPDCRRRAVFWTAPDDGNCPACGHPRAIPATARTRSRRGRPHRAWCVPCRDDSTRPTDELEATR